jgi:hypothetical protein
MRHLGPIRFLALGVAVASLAGMALTTSAGAAAPVSCSNPKSVTNVKKGTSTITLTGCTNPKATGGKGTGVVTFKALNAGSSKVAGKITWNKTGTTTFSLSSKAGKTPNKCPKGTVLFLSTGKVLGGTGAALKLIPKGSPYSESVCANTTTGKTTMAPGTKVLI